MALQSTTEVILDGPDTYHAWYAMIKTSVVKDLWKYVDPESAEEYEEPEEVTFDMVKEGARTLRELSNPEKTIYLNLRSDAKTDRLQYQRYLTEETKVRGKIMSTTTMATKALLQEDKSVRRWIISLQSAMKPTDSQMTDIIRARHRKVVGSKFIAWPMGGPYKWLDEWQKLMIDCERWCPALHESWAGDFNLVWSDVPDAKRLCDRLVEATIEQKEGWKTSDATRQLRQAWEQKTIKADMTIQGKAKTTRSSFATYPQFDGVAPDNQKEPQTPTTPNTLVNRTRNRSRDRSTSRKRAGTASTQGEGKQRGQKKARTPCWGCSGTHEDFRCPLITDYNPQGMKIPSEWQETFDRKMSDGEFSRKVKLLREAKQVRRQFLRSAEDDNESGKE